ncbi:MAG: c-type cytochrome biogenesis protein CcmI, partial [Deltaproteobacteria bacterium]
MLFWVVTSILSAGVALALLSAAKRGAVSEDDPSVALARTELADIERDLSRGTLTVGEADALRTEIKRRLIRTSSAPKTLMTGQGRSASVLIAMVPVMAALALYL